MAITQKEISNLIVSMFDAAAGAANLASLEAFVAAKGSSYTLADMASDLGTGSLHKSQYTGMDNAAIAESLATQLGATKNMFGLYATTESMNVYNFFKTNLDLGHSVANLQHAAMNFLTTDARAATDYAVAKATMENKQAVAEYYSVTKAQNGASLADLQAVLDAVTNDTATVDTAKATIDTASTVTGKTITLTDGFDNVTGTAADDMFLANVVQASDKSGAITNQFATGDVIDGGAGTKDELFAKVQPDQITQDGSNAEITATTKNVEMARFEAIDGNVTIDAGSLDGVKEYWSDDSEGNLNIEDIRLGTGNSVTKDITFGIKDNDHSSDFIASFASPDLTNAGTVTSNSQIVIEAAYEDKPADVDNTNPTKDLFVKVTFTGTKADGTTGTFDSGYLKTNSTALDAGDIYPDTYEGLKDMLKATLDAQGFSNLTVSLGSTFTNITTDAGTKALQTTGTQILITDPAGNAFSAITSAAGSESSEATSDVASRIEAIDPTTSTTLIESNLILDNAGKDSTMGDVFVGGESNSDKGVEKMTIMADRDSAIDSFSTSDSELQQVVITSTISSLKDSTGANGTLEIGDIDGWDTAANTSIDATAFKGSSLMVGQTTESNAAVSAAVVNDGTVTDVNTFNASGITGSVRYDAEVGTVAATEEEAYTVTTGSGKDTVNMDVDYDGAEHDEFSLNITTDSGDDTVNLTYADQSASSMTNSSNLGNITVNTGAGNDKVTVGTDAGTLSNAIVDLGDGADFITSANDAAKSTWTYNADVSGASYVGRGNTEHKVFKLKVAVEFQGIVSDFVDVAYSASGYTTSSTAINNAVKAAIDAKFSNLLSYEDIRNDGLQITSKVDRDLNNEDFNLVFLAPKYTQHDATGDADSTLEQTDNVYYQNDSIEIFSARNTTNETEIGSAWKAWYPDSEGASGTVDFSSGTGIYTQLGAASTALNVYEEMFRASDSADVNSSGNDANINGNNTDDADTDENMQYTNNPGDGGVAVATSYNKLGLTSAGVDDNEVAINKITGGAGDDLIVLNSNNAAGAGYETIVLTAGFGTDTVLNFNTGTVTGTADVIDYTAFLDPVAAARGSSASSVAANDMRTEQDVPYAFQSIVANEAGDNAADGAGSLADMVIDHNKVINVEFSDIFASLTAAQIATLTKFEDLTADMLTTAVNAGTTDADFVMGGVAESKMDNTKFVINVIYDRQLEKNAAGTVILGDEVDYSTQSVFSLNVAYDGSAAGDNLSVDGVVKQGTIEFADMYSDLADMTTAQGAKSMAGTAAQIADAAAAITTIGNALNTVANIQGLSALPSSYNLQDTAANLAAANAATLNGATNITATDAATYAQAATIYAATNSGTTTYSISDTAVSLVAGATLNAAVNVAATNAATVAQAEVIADATNTGTTTYAVADTWTNIEASADDATANTKNGLAGATTITMTAGIAAGAEVITLNNLTADAAGTAIDFVDNAVTMTQAEAVQIGTTDGFVFTDADVITVTGVTVAGGDFAQAATIDLLNTGDTIDLDADPAALDAANFHDVFTTQGILATATDNIEITADGTGAGGTIAASAANDTFFQVANDANNFDTITGLSTSDKFDFQAADGSANGAILTAAEANAAAVDGQTKWYFDNATDTLTYWNDGAGAAATVVLTGVATVTVDNNGLLSVATLDA